MVANSQLQEIYCVIDGLDECEKDSMEKFLSLLTELCSPGTKSIRVKFFLTSRPERHIEKCLRGHALSISANSNAAKGDIEIR